MTYRVAGVNFDGGHMHGNLGWAADHPDCEIVGLAHEDGPGVPANSMESAAEDYGVPDDDCYDDVEACLEAVDPDLVISVPTDGEHGDYVERIAAFDVHCLIEKPLGLTIEEARRVVDAYAEKDERLAVNYGFAWNGDVRTVKRLIDEGTIGDVMEVHYYGGFTGHDLSTWYGDPDLSGGSMSDWMGYGTVIGTWFRDGEVPSHVTGETYTPEDMDVNAQAVAVASYEQGMSTFETRWRTFTDPWGGGTQPANGWDVRGTEGQLSTRGFDGVRVQTVDDEDGEVVEPDPVEPPHENALQYLLDHIEAGEPLEGPTAPAVAYDGQRIIETARLSARRGERLPLVE